MKSILAIAALTAFAGAANAQIGSAVSASDNFLSESIDSDAGFTSAGDMFGIRQRPDNAPFAIYDDSAVGFPGDTLGIITEADTARFFGLVDNINGQNSGAMTATWTFDIAGYTDLSVAADMAAMGDFEASNDLNLFTWSIDGSTPAALFTSSVNEDGDLDYTLAGGAVVTLSDPMLMNGTTLSNVFQNISAAVSGTGSVLTIQYSGQGDGGSEAFAFRNLTVNGVIPTPGAAALLGLAGVAGIRRRRA